MPTKLFTSGRIRKAVYDSASRQLDLHWDNKSVLAYKHVPQGGVPAAVQRAEPRRPTGKTGLPTNIRRARR